MSNMIDLKPNLVYTKLKEMIVYFEIKPGETISETEASNLFGVSRTSVREAFKKLELEGLLEITPKKGTVVSLISMDAINDILFLRESIEISCIRFLSTQENGTQYYKLSNILKKQEDVINNKEFDNTEKAKLFYDYDNEFHKMIFKLAGHERLWDIISKLDYQYSRFRVFLNISNKTNFDLLYKEHVKLFDMIVNKEVQLIEKEFHNHLYSGIRKSSMKISEFPEYFLEN